MYRLNSVIFFLNLSVLCVIQKVHSLDGEGIQGGELANEGEYPYQVSVGSSYSSYCGGGIIDKRFVITAAHCVTDGEGKLLKKSVRIVAGVSKLNSYHRNRVAVYVDKIYMPKEYMNIDPKKYSNGDIVVLRLATELPLDSNPHIKKLELPEKDQLYVKSKAVIAGYGWDEVRVTVDPISGRSDEVGKTSGNLRFAEAMVISNRECQWTYSSQITDKHLCAKVNQRVSRKPEGVCSGDSGGPLVYNGNTIIGVVSFSPLGCEETIGSGVYTRVSSFIDFVQKAMKDSSDPEIVSITLPTR